MAARDVALDEWRRLSRRKLVELDEHIANIQATREPSNTACAAGTRTSCNAPNFGSLITARLAGQPLQEAHTHQLLRKATATSANVTSPVPWGAPQTATSPRAGSRADPGRWGRASHSASSMRRRLL
jgi:hypothetical protein